jgi:pimeloyl-ACP methyl ester carboxylesterase
MSERTITAPDGRALRVYESGKRHGTPVLAIYGTPSSGVIYAPHTADAETKGIRLITWDRPGYGDSTPRPGRSVADVVEDVVAIADELELERFVVWGVSGGGPHALACAALLDSRVGAVASLASPAPYDADGLDWSAGMGEDNIEEFAATLEGRLALEPLLKRHAAGFAEISAEEIRSIWATLLSPADLEVTTGRFAEFMLENVRRALDPSVEGWVEDDLAFVEPWGFALEDIGVPVLLWHGVHDRFVPIEHGRWLADRIPGVEARLSEEDGHLTLYERRVPDVHAWLLERL